MPNDQEENDEVLRIKEYKSERAADIRVKLAIKMNELMKGI